LAWRSRPFGPTSPRRGDVSEQQDGLRRRICVQARVQRGARSPGFRPGRPNRLTLAIAPTAAQRVKVRELLVARSALQAQRAYERTVKD
jgi:hypothetical protein